MQVKHVSGEELYKYSCFRSDPVICTVVTVYIYVKKLIQEIKYV